MNTLDPKTADQLRLANERLVANDERMRAALLVAIDALRTDMDIPDVMALGGHCAERIKQRRIALRMCESAIR